MKEQLRIIADANSAVEMAIKELERLFEAANAAPGSGDGYAMQMVANTLRTALWESQRALDTLVLDDVCGDDLEDATV